MHRVVHHRAFLFANPNPAIVNNDGLSRASRQHCARSNPAPPRPRWISFFGKNSPFLPRFAFSVPGSSGRRRLWRLGLGGRLFAFDVCDASLPFDRFVILLAHISLP